jgi:phosphoserine phosphatase RsbU/P
MTMDTLSRETQTTLRVLPRALLVSGAGTELATAVRNLEDQGYLVFRAADAGTALTQLRAARYQLVVVDVTLTGSGSADLVRSLRADDALADLPVLVMSHGDDMEAIERCLDRGADDYIPRACGPAMARVRVSAALDRRRARESDDLRREMLVARGIQRDFLPESLPDVPGVQLAAALHPAGHVSGDFYDAFQLFPSGRLVLVMGDVCDKGTGAAMFMALFRSLIRASADPVDGGATLQMTGEWPTPQLLDAAAPEELLLHVAGFTNNYIARLHGRTNMFATAFLATLDPHDGELVYVNAGHEPGLIVAPDGAIESLRPTGPALGMIPDATFRAVVRTLERGHSLFAFTDGVIEARNASEDVFGGDRVHQALHTHRSGGATALVSGMLDAVRAFAGQADPHDDLTLLAATRSG